MLLDCDPWNIFLTLASRRIAKVHFEEQKVHSEVFLQFSQENLKESNERKEQKTRY
uniref:AlNc14C373G11139 protein n=1 Tax=Albugo laibachii Nc14 TaxID=890382 RepID=F0WY79_9STRA|nr:AlNc14C373G11139 [Albugo laibachii Nc14]|eukprot:CCA26431.1 AlNc14C373G11139 [Albugo laibachii Nc14]